MSGTGDPPPPTRKPLPDHVVTKWGHILQESAVKVSNVAYMNIRGTSASEVAVKFDCSKSSPCQGILLENINLVGNGGKETTMSCSNIVQGTTEGKVYPPSCL